MTVSYLASILHNTTSLITILNPIAAATVLVSLMPSASQSEIHIAARKATITTFIALIITLFAGKMIFNFFGISVLSLKVIGGVILMMIAINMAYGYSHKARHSPEEHIEAEDKDDVAIIPLSIPLLYGPGTIATVVVLNDNLSEKFSQVAGYGIATIVVFLSSVIVFIVLRNASLIIKTLGITGVKILTRIMGLIVGAVAAQFLVGGIKGLWGTL